MSRPFKVGDIVHAQDRYQIAWHAAIEMITDSGNYIIDGCMFSRCDLTLVRAVDKPAKAYKEQFEAWRPIRSLEVEFDVHSSKRVNEIILGLHQYL